MHPFLHIHRANTSGRDFVVSDLHGCYGALQQLLRHVDFHPSSDRLFSVGDLIDRGPQSLQCLELLGRPWFLPSLGNHEHMLIQHLRHPEHHKPYDTHWLGKELRSMTERQMFAGRFLPLLERLPYISFVESSAFPFYTVHAEILESRASVTSKMIKEEDFSNLPKTKHRLVWGRALIGAYEEDKPVRRAHNPSLPIVFCGHTIVEAPIQLARQVYLDGGGYRGFEGGTSTACVRMFDTSTKNCWACFPHTGVIEKQRIVVPKTL